MKIVISNIEWNTDGEDIDLPTEITVNFKEILNKEDIPELIAEYLSSNYDFCVINFTYEIN